MYAPNSGYAMNQYPGGVPVTAPMQAGFQPQFSQVATPGAMATAYQAQVPPKYEDGGYTKMGNNEV